MSRDATNPVLLPPLFQYFNDLTIIAEDALEDRGEAEPHGMIRLVLPAPTSSIAGLEDAGRGVLRSGCTNLKRKPTERCRKPGAVDYGQFAGKPPPGTGMRWISRKNPRLIHRIPYAHKLLRRLHSASSVLGKSGKTKTLNQP